MEQNLRFGVALGRLVALKKIWADYEQLLRQVFFMFRGAKKNFKFEKNIVASALKSYIM